MKKLGCAKCGGTKKMKLGGSAVAKAPVNMYGIPQENMGTSSQMGFGRNGGSVKKPLAKAQKGTTVKTKPIPNDVYKRDSTNYSNAANKYLSSKSTKDYNEGRDSLNAIKTRYGSPNELEKRMNRTIGGYDLKKKGGSVKKMQVGGTSTAPKKPIVKKTVAPKKTTVPRKIIDSSVPMSGPDRPMQKPMMAKKGGVVKSKKK